MKQILLLIFLCTIATTAVDCSKILAILPTTSKSHWILAQPLLRELAKSGHEVTVISPFPVSNPPKNYRSIFSASMEKEFEQFMNTIFDEVDVNPIVKMAQMYSMLNDLTNRTMHAPAVVELMKSDEKFDLLFLELFLDDALLGFAHHYNCPVVAMSTVGAIRWINDVTGSPNPLSYVPNVFLPFTDRMSFWQRLANFLFAVFEDVAMRMYFFDQQSQIYDEYFPGPKPTLQELRSKGVALALLNSHFSMSFPRPYLPNLIEVGGMHVSHEPKPLPEDLEKFIMGAKHGVIYFSMGGNIIPSKMPKEKQAAILKALSERKERVIWKWDDAELAKTMDPEKFFIRNWFPQDDILAHPNVKVFITHGGLLGSTEAIHHGVPLIGIPIFGDQKLNMARAEMSGYGIQVEFKNLTEASLRWALEEMLSTDKYRVAVKSFSKKFHDKPMTPLQLAKFWVEYVLRNDGAEHMKSAALDLNFFQYYSLDILLFLLAVVTGFFGCLVYACRKCCCAKKTRGDKKKKN